MRCKLENAYMHVNMEKMAQLERKKMCLKVFLKNEPIIIRGLTHYARVQNIFFIFKRRHGKTKWLNLGHV